MVGFQVISLTDAAAERVREIIAASDEPVYGVRIGLKNAGCAGMSYTMDYVRDENAPGDVVEDKGVRIYVDPTAVLFLLGTVMDFEVTTLSSGFTFSNPNQVSACGCGESVEIKPAEASALAN
ncbi:iron-sulfur cluster assembly accessory protein [Breoghania sp. L-A4]|uniref:HesB/IscA family protein n=1 Tax=Breoghania sp. L-A4 TaxID=2304600 RepID=UPI000E35C147|nr:iron-sulfur cluster assembly accessory protein [Breoghania sp. L-A4]AXS40518.1 iron-sulfur cluster assembly accessory protein [Breoghania sp. L-A4]